MTYTLTTTGPDQKAKGRPFENNPLLTSLIGNRRLALLTSLIDNRRLAYYGHPHKPELKMLFGLGHFIYLFCCSNGLVSLFFFFGGVISRYLTVWALFGFAYLFCFVPCPHFPTHQQNQKHFSRNVSSFLYFMKVSNEDFLTETTSSLTWNVSVKLSAIIPCVRT